MIHFDFTLDDVDAETLFDLFNSHITRLHLDITNRIVKKTQSKDPDEKAQQQAEIDWLEDHIKYLERLKTKLHHTNDKDRVKFSI